MPEGLAYAGGLLLVIGCLALLDRRWRLAMFAAPDRTLRVLVGGLAVFGLWDSAGIALGIFQAGHSRLYSHWFLAPNFPVEELGFLVVLLYCTLLLWRWLERR